MTDVSNAAGAIEDALLGLKALAPPLALPFWQTISAQLKLFPQQTLAAPPPIPAIRQPSRVMPSGIVFALTCNLELVRDLTTQGRDLGYAVVHVRESNELIERARVRVPSAVLIDMQDRSPEMMLRTMAAMRTLPGTENSTAALLESAAGPVPEAIATHAGASLRLPNGTNVDVIAAAVGRLIASRPQQTRVLVVDDDPTFGQLVLAVLGPRGIAARHLTDPTKIFDTLEELNPDLVLLDMMMPQAHGLEVCKQIRANGKWRHLSVLFLTGQSDIEQRIAGFRAGADDYLVKPVVNEELLARVEVRVERAKLMRDRADRDALTGLALRRAFIQQLEARIGESKRFKRPLSLALINLDHFKKINDQYGHLVGDHVLAAMGQLLGTRLRTEDLRGRWGGEELVLGLPNTPAPMAREVLSRLLDELVHTPFKTDDGRQFEVSFSAGVAAYGEDGETTESLLRVADTRLYAAKQAGRKRVA
ncbi:MAG: diguanylate cyclase [Clostridia bacterium]|nr:diguanylate cyclase [Deltaproteobacteria bacterium]